ncbi:uncharacterized protein LOC128998283 [Macrosteles quadrilineatus]|uniref:uncharacterized protein LOC128998283 n=1 Tax=Macrosteles quadrilineatus TaxID=74068 RepID=UPI0023E2A74D|nr:uncharacterized protein LOC128998283 [Macrosteles quadrilineatus]
MSSPNDILVDLDIESVLQCPVCFEIPPSIIFMCKVGHHMCERCRLRLQTCPTCKASITSCRNYLAESLSNKFSILLKGSGDGDVINNLNEQINVYLNKKAVSEEVNQLKRLPNPTGMYKCLLESCCNRSEMAVTLLFAHIKKVHPHLFDTFKNTTTTFTHKFENFCYRKHQTKYHRAFSVTNLGLFFLNLETLPDQYINCWISVPAPLKQCSLFQCELVFTKELDKTKNLIFSSKVGSNSHGKEKAFENGKVFVIPPEDHLMKDGEFFSINVKIVYTKPNENPNPTS